MKALKIIGKILMWVLIVVAVLLVLLWTVATVAHFDFFTHSKTMFQVPGLSDGFIGQGFDLMEDGTYLMCGYMKDGSASRVYVRTAEGESHYVQLMNGDGTPYTKHSGGLCHNGDYVYVAGSNGVEVFALEDVLDGGEATRIGSIEVGYSVAYCYFYNDCLLAGNFYYPETYETPESHRITTPAGDENVALISVFQADESCDFGIDPTPVAAISTGEKVQGICFTDEGQIVLSTSYAVKSSRLYIHTVDTQRVGTAEVLDTQVPLYYLDSATLTDTIKAPPMAEELVFQDGRILIMNESASSKYIFGKFTRGTKIYGYELP